MYPRNRFQVPRPIPVYTSKQAVSDEEKVKVNSIPAPNVPEDDEISIDDNRQRIPVKNELTDGERFIGNSKPLFRFFNVKFWLDDIIILGLIILLASEKRDGDFILPVLIYLLLGGKVY